MSTYKFDLARRLADSYGIQGGCYRRWGLAAEDDSTRADLLLKSIRKYREGESVESNNEYGIVSTYNLLNKTVSQILLDARFYDDPSAAVKYPELEPIDARAELEKVRKEMRRQLHRDDSWFLADHALVSLLLDYEKEDPKDIYKEFLNPEKIHPSFVYDSMLATLRALAKLDLPMAGKIEDVVQRLDERYRQLQN
ncbi:MAG TPA: hypothetical protein VE262_16005 [Blastocatellia bacterium]|nr:hypothetical protein [Blastocatellia bacterium]